MNSKIMLSILFFCASVFTTVAQESEKTDKAKFTSFAPALFKDKYKADAQLLDARNNTDYSLSHLLGAKSLPMESKDFKKIVQELNKQENIFIYGSSVEESSTLCDALANIGFLYVYNLNGNYNNLVSLGMKVAR